MLGRCTNGARDAVVRPKVKHIKRADQFRDGIRPARRLFLVCEREQAGIRRITRIDIYTRPGRDLILNEWASRHRPRKFPRMNSWLRPAHRQGRICYPGLLEGLAAAYGPSILRRRKRPVKNGFRGTDI